MNVVIYARYSSSSQREASIEEQVKICTEYAEKNNYTIYKVYKDSALTGKNDNRPALQSLLSDCPKKMLSLYILLTVSDVI